MDSTVSGHLDDDTRRRVRVLVVNSTFDMGGAERVTFELFTHLNQSHCDVAFCSFYAPGTIGEAALAAGYPFHRDLMRSKFDARGLIRLKSILREQHIDIIYMAVQPVTLFWGVVASRLFRVPIVALVSNTVVVREHLKLRTYGLLMPYVSRIVAVSHAQKANLVREIGVSPDLVTVIHNGIDIRRFETSLDERLRRSEYGLRPEATIVGLVARLVELKAVDVLLRAARIVLDSRSDVQFVIVGTGPELATLRQLAQALQVDRHVVFTGHLNEPTRITACFDVAVLCSRTEALPMAVLEYMAAGKPSVVTDVGGLRELVVHGENGYVVAPGDCQALARSICQLLEDPVRAREMGKRAFQIVTSQFSLDLMAEKTASLLRELARDRWAPAR